MTFTRRWKQVVFAFSLFALQIFSMPATAQAQILNWDDPSTTGCVQDVDVGGGVTVTDVATIKGFECLLRNVLGAATTFIGLASFVMIIVGAFLYLTSGGNTKGTEAAKQTITYAIIGIVVSLMAYFILNFVAIFTGVRGILQFNLNIGQ